MEKERRVHSRIRIDAVSQFIVSRGDRYEGDFEGTIQDISEEGICVYVGNSKCYSLVDSLHLKDEFFFQAFDEYTVFKATTSDIFQGKAAIVRIDKKDDGYYLGCKIVSKNHDLDNFISRRKMAFYIDGMATPK